MRQRATLLTHVTPAVFEAFDLDGFVVVPGALDAQTLTELSRAFDDAPAQTTGTQHVAIGEQTPAREAWEALKTHPWLQATAKHLLGSAFHVRDVHGRNPLPGYGLQGLHADWTELPAGSPYVILTTLWMIDGFSPNNGSTRVVPGTHRALRSVPREMAQPTSRHPDERQVTGAPGSVLFLNGHTWHSGTLNRSQGPRRAVQLIVQRGAAP